VITGLTHQVLLTVLAAASGIAAALLLSITSGPKITPNVSLGQLIGYNLLVIAGILGLRVLYTILKNR
jgi:ubiquinone biosynthesis protein